MIDARWWFAGGPPVRLWASGCPNSDIGAPETYTAAADYWDTENIHSEAPRGMLALVSPDDGKKKDGGKVRKRRSNPAMERIRELLKTDEAGALQAAQDDCGAGLRPDQAGARHPEFCLREGDRTKVEWKLICLTHNLLKLYRHDWLPKRADLKLLNPTYVRSLESARDAISLRVRDGCVRARTQLVNVARSLANPNGHEECE